jgi:hypothetical protein
MLKNSRNIGEFEKHDFIFKMSIPCLKCCFHSSPSLMHTKLYAPCRYILI